MLKRRLTTLFFIKKFLLVFELVGFWGGSRIFSRGRGRFGLFFQNIFKKFSGQPKNTIKKQFRLYFFEKLSKKAVFGHFLIDLNQKIEFFPSHAALQKSIDWLQKRL